MAARRQISFRQSSGSRHVIFASSFLLVTCQLNAYTFFKTLVKPTVSTSAAVATDASNDPMAKEFASLPRKHLLLELDQRWSSLFQALKQDTYDAIDRDPFFTIDTTGLLRRYLLATRFDVDKALERLEATAKWRRDWDVLSYYNPGTAAQLFGEDSNPGAEMYFADSLAFDANGVPYLAGRLKYANAENMHPWNHLRAGVLVFELLANKIARAGRGPGTYILDIGSVGGIAGQVSGTGGLENKTYNEALNPYYSSGEGSKAAPSQELLDELGSLDNGFAVLKAAIRILNCHYPGFITRVFYLNSDMLFWGAFKIFSRWISDRGSIDFQFLGPAGWREEPIDTLLEFIPSDQLFTEWGGSGASLEGDRFLQRAIEYYENEVARSVEANQKMVKK